MVGFSFFILLCFCFRVRLTSRTLIVLRIKTNKNWAGIYRRFYKQAIGKSKLRLNLFSFLRYLVFIAYYYLYNDFLVNENFVENRNNFFETTKIN